MVAAVIPLYFFGTALSVLAVLYGIVDSFGGLMYVQDCPHVMDFDWQTQWQLSPGRQRRASPPAKNVGS